MFVKKPSRSLNINLFESRALHSQQDPVDAMYMQGCRDDPQLMGLLDELFLLITGDGLSKEAQPTAKQPTTDQSITTQLVTV